MRVAKYLWHQLSGASAAAAAMAAALAARIGMALAAPWVVGQFLDGVVHHRPVAQLDLWAALMLAAAVLTPLATFAASWAGWSVEWTVANRLRERLTALALDWAPSQHRSLLPGEFVERVDGDVSALGALLSSLSLEVLGSAGQALGALAGLFAVSQALGLVLAGLTAAVAGVLESFRRRTVPLAEAERQANAHTYGLVGELLAAREDLAAAGAGAYALGRLSAAQAAWLPAYVRAELSGYRAWAWSLGAFGLAEGAAYLVSGHLYATAHLPLGTVYVMVAYVGLLAAPLSALRGQVEQLQRAQGSLVRVMDWDQPPPPSRRGAAALPAGALAVSVAALAYRHREGGGGGISGITFELAPGAHLGVVGASGAGKSTLAALLAQMAQPDRGTIHLSGIPASEVDSQALRRRVAYLPQAPALFCGSVQDNVALFDPKVPARQVALALEAVGLSSWAGQLDRPLDRQQLSAGEVELLSLARVWVRDAGLVILDEPASRLDAASQRRVMEALERVLAGRTAVVVSHRLGALVPMDALLVLEDGRQVEFGPAARLAGTPVSRFARLLAAERAREASERS